MKKIVITLMVLFTFLGTQSFAQELTKEEKKAQRIEEKQRKKEEKARLREERIKAKEAEKAARAEAEKQAQLAGIKAIQDNHYVVETHTLRDRYGNTYQLSSTINFVARYDDKATVQIGLVGLTGWNGVGGITVTGNVTKEELLTDKEGNVYGQKFKIMSSLGFAEVRVEVGSGGRTSAYISTMDTGGQLVFSGFIVPMEDTRVYKGMDIF